MSRVLWNAGRGALTQDDYYYEIQLTNKQLVFYFLAGATGLILSFLVGVMVGREVNQGAGDVHAARPAVEERVISEETPRPASPAADLSYAQRLEGDKADDGPQKKAAAAPGTEPAAAAPHPAAAKANPAPAVADATKPASDGAPAADTAARPAVVRSVPPRPLDKTAAKVPPTGRAIPAVGSGNLTIQVGAFKDRSSADAIVSRLKAKGFAAYV